MTDPTGDSPIIRPEGFDILYEEGPCLVVVKPGGVATQAPPGIDSLEVRVKQFLRVRDSKPGNVYLGVPHRLDRPVSGVMVLARHVRAARRLSEQFEARTVRKTYWAVVEGKVSPDCGTWTDHLRKIPDAAQVEVVAPDHPEGGSRCSITAFWQPTSTARGWKSTSKPAGCTRSASKPRTVPTRFWAIPNTDRLPRSDRPPTIFGAAGLPCMPAVSNSAIR